MNHVSHAFYDASGNMVKSVDNLGNPTYFTYDDSGNPIRNPRIFLFPPCDVLLAAG